MNQQVASNFLSVTSSAAHIVPSTVTRTISYWKLGEQVTGGRWSQIFRAAPKSLAQHSAFDYAIKVVNPDLSDQDSIVALERLGREAAAIDSIQHHGIIPLLDAELDQPTFFLVQPWVAGGTLDRFMAVAADISLIRCLWILRQVAEALAAAHDNQRVYLGTDPTHVLLGSGGRIMLTGWSNSQIEGQPLQIDINRFSSAKYTAPEDFDSQTVATTPSDVYGLGMLAYRMIAGRLPFRESKLDQLIENRRSKVPTELIRIQPSTPIRLSELVQAMTAADPADRPSIRQVLDQLISIEIDNLKNPTLIKL